MVEKYCQEFHSNVEQLHNSLRIKYPSPNGVHNGILAVYPITPKSLLIGLLVDQRLYTSVYYTRQYYNIPSCCITVRLSCCITVRLFLLYNSQTFLLVNSITAYCCNNLYKCLQHL